jgi:branched-chain amino acid transport system permease protein
MMLDAVSSIIISGLVLGSLYALMASGLSLVWTTLGIFNFAHGVLMAVGAFVAYQIAQSLLPTLWVGFPCILALVAMAVVGAVFEVALVRPFYGREDMVMVTIMTTLAGLTFLENGILALWGPRLKQLSSLASGTASIGPAHLSWQELLTVLITPAVLIAVLLFMRRTQIGRAIRAVGQNRKAAELVGIPVRRMFALTFALSAVLAGLAGMLLGSIRFMTPTMGSDPLVKALIVVIFGGLGSIGGSIGAAYVIGFVEALLVFGVGLYWTPSILFLIMITVLLFRPQGLFGNAERLTV